MAGLMATLLPQSEPGESGGNCKMPPGGSVGSALARDGSPGLVVVAGTMVGWPSGAASVTSGLPLTNSQAVKNTLADKRFY